MTHPLRSPALVLATSLSIAACGGGADTRSASGTASTSSGGASTTASADAQQPAPLPSVDSLAPAVQPGKDREHPVLRCGPRDSYYYVATEFRCGDGSNPFNGNLLLGQRSRLGNVGANSTGHIIDLYQVPCPEGPQRVFVDMYGCPGSGGATPTPAPTGPGSGSTPFPGST